MTYLFSFGGFPQTAAFATPGIANSDPTIARKTRIGFPSLAEPCMRVSHEDRAEVHTPKAARELANAIFEYLKIFHNRQRRHSALGMLSPIEYEIQYASQTAA